MHNARRRAQLQRWIERVWTDEIAVDDESAGESPPDYTQTNAQSH